MAKNHDLVVIGGGLAGSEATWQAAERGLQVVLYEMRPGLKTGAHVSEDLAELICSNSLGSNLPDRASGLLKNELRRMGSLLIQVADEASVPAGGALAVDREKFASEITKRIEAHPNIKVVREEMADIPNGLCIVASGPLTSSRLSKSIADLTGQDHLYFYDAISPIVSADSVDMSIAYRGSRYGRGTEVEGDYINCPFTKKEFEEFVRELVSAERIHLREFETEIREGVRAGLHHYFEGCLPIEVIAERGPQALAFGPMRPVGLNDPRTGEHARAVVQLRQDNLAASLHNMVGFQTNLIFGEQKRVFRMIPGMAHAQFERYGQMHRNTFINSPSQLWASLQFRHRSDLLFAGQITGVEGYVGNIGTGLLAGLNAARLHFGETPLALPPSTMLGALCHYIVHSSPQDFQPMKANFSILPKLVGMEKSGRRIRAQAFSQRALNDLDAFLRKTPDLQYVD